MPVSTKSLIAYGYYYVDYNDNHLLSHSGGKIDVVDVKHLRKEFETVKNMSTDEATGNSPLLQQQFTGTISPQKYYQLTSSFYNAQSEFDADKNSSDPQKVTYYQRTVKADGLVNIPIQAIPILATVLKPKRLINMNQRVSAMKLILRHTGMRVSRITYLQKCS